MADNNDALFNEIEEELRRERYAKLWQQYGNFILAGAALIVRVDVSQEAAKTHAFAELLARQQIAWDPAESAKQVSKRPPEPRRALASSEQLAAAAPEPVEPSTGPPREDVREVRVVVTPRQMHGCPRRKSRRFWARQTCQPRR